MGGECRTELLTGLTGSQGHFGTPSSSPLSWVAGSPESQLLGHPLLLPGTAPPSPPSAHPACSCHQWMQPDGAGFPESGEFDCFIFPSATSQHSVFSPRSGAQQPGQRETSLLLPLVLFYHPFSDGCSVFSPVLSWVPSLTRGRQTDWTTGQERGSEDQLCFFKCEERDLARVFPKPAIWSTPYCLATNTTSSWNLSKAPA